MVTDKQGTATTTEFMWQGDNLIGEVTGSDYKTYVYEPGTFRPLAQISGEGRNNAEVYYYHLDQIGTPIELTDVQGQSVWSVQYRAYGNVLAQHTEEIESALRFQGQYYDAETGLHYNRHRYYSPGTGRFTTIDPIGLAGGLNNYQYVPNPTGWVDPLGLVSTPDNNCPKHNAWNEFQKDHTGQFKSRTEASKAYNELKKNQSPWPYGYDPESNVRTMQPGDTFNMIVDNGMEDMPGQFGTTDFISNSTYGRQNLAIKEGWKPTLDNVVTYRVRKSFDVYEGPVGPQIDGKIYLKGGGTQIVFKDPQVSWSNARPNEYNDFTADPYLEIVDIRKLDE